MTFASKSLVPMLASLVGLSWFSAATPAQVFQYSLQGDTGSCFGWVVGRVGDIDKDGYEDFIVGAPCEGSNDEGAAIVFSGATGTQISFLSGANAFDQFGSAVEGRLDLDGDGWNDVLVGAPSDAPTSAGSVLAYSPHLQQKLYTLAGSTGQGLGASIRSLQADIDGDGIDDFIVGAPNLDPSVLPAAYVYSGAKGALLFAKTGQAGSNFGWAVARAGDVDGDGMCDFYVGSPIHVDGSFGQLGRIACFSGADGKRIWAVDGLSVGSMFGFSIAEVGDLDGDGVPDCIVGAPLDVDLHGAATGTVNAISGATGAYLFSIDGDAAGDQFGYDVRATSGDIDGDGQKDFIVGAPGTFASPGYARTFSAASGFALNTYVEQTADPSGSYAKYGCSVAGGDFNGDGRTDVLIGNYHFNGTQGLIEIFDTVVASWQNYGTGWAGTLGVPSFTSNAPPAINTQITLTAANSAGVATPGILVIGLTQATIPTGKGGTLLVAPLLFQPVTIPVGGLNLTSVVPYDPRLCGVNVDLQALELDAGASNGLAFTAGLDLLLGFS